MRRIRQTRSFQAIVVPLGMMAATLLNVAWGQTCTPTFSYGSEQDTNPCYGVTNSACNGITKVQPYTATFPDGNQQTRDVNGTGGAGSAGACNAGVVTPAPSDEYWPIFYYPQIGDGYATFSETNQSTNCVMLYCGWFSIPYCGVFTVAQSGPWDTYVTHTCSSCT